jgi:sec-independent protein translocase protein TatC
MALVKFPGSVEPDPDDRHIHLTDPDVFDDEAAGAKMSFLDHLDELRKRLIHSVVAVLVGVGATFYFHNQIYNFVLVEPLRRILPPGSKLIYTEPGEAFSLHLKIALIAGVLTAAPYIMYQVWLFIAPGLYTHEKKMAIPFVLLSTGGAIAGAAFNHYVLYPFMMAFFGGFAGTELLFLPKLDPVFSLYTNFLIACVLIFQIPTVVFFLARMKIVTARFLVRNFKYAVLVTFVASAVITPTGDPGTQTVFALPMIGLYIISIGIAWLVAPVATKL